MGLYLENSTNGSIRYVNISSGLQLAVNLSNTSSFVFENNTISSPTTCINISSTSSDNLFYHNELYNCTTYIDNKNETNLFNTTASGTAQGNYYQNILGLPIYDTDNDGWGDYGSGYPLSASTQGGNWTGYGQDWGPRASSQAAPPSLTPLYPENNSLFIDTTLINFTFYVENPVGEVSCAVIINGTTYNESTPAQHNSNLTIWRNLPNGNYSWQPYCNNSFSLSSTGAQSIFSINISGGQIPEISNLTCSNETGIYKNCTEFVYGEKIVNISLSCTDPNNNIVRASYLLTNEPDTIALINTSNATVVVLTDWIAEVNHTINDSGDFNLTASCIDEYGNTANITNNWSIPWGHLAASVVSHSSNASVVQGEFFTFTARVTCLGGECGGVEATLDPIELPLFGNITILDDISELASNLIHQLKTPEDERKEGFVILNVIGEEVNISKKETQDQNHIQNISAENQQIKYGSILVYSTPENATIYLNESPIGVTPLVIGNLSEANYSLRLEKSGFASYYLPSVEVILGQNTSINVNLQILKSTENVSQQLTVVFTLKNTSKGGEYTITNGTDGKFNITFVKRQDAATTGSAISPPQRAALYRIAESVPQPKVELYGVVPGEVKVVIDYVDDSRIKTDVVAVSNITIESAKIILPTEDKVDAILHCPNFDQESFSCPEWKATQIPFVQYPTYIEFNVSSFSGYAGGLLNESYLVIWSETNPRMPYGGKSRAAGQEIKFLANYTQGQVGDVIGPSEGTCIIQFKKQADPDSYYTVPLQMSFNSTSSLYENHSILAENTSYTFRVSCNSSEYKSQNTTDNIILPTTKTGAISTVQGAFPFYTISPNPQTNCTSLKKDESCTFSWNVNATGNLFTIHAFFVDFNTTNYSSFVSNTRTEIINITISVYDISPPVVVDTSITPKIASNGSQVYLYATVTDNVQVDKMWANITLPNSSMVEISSIPTTYVTPQIYGRYNITFYANDTAGNTANASDYFEVSEPVQFHFSTLTANQSDLYVNMTFLYPNSTAIVKNLLGNSSFVVELSESILDLKTKSFNGSFNITFMEINVSRENGGNLQMDLFAYAPSGDLNFKGGVAFNTSLNFTNADISFSYSWLNLSLSDEQNAVLYKCSKWDFEKSICLSSWIVANATKVLENDIYLLTETSSDPAYLIVIKPYCGDGVCHYSVGENCATCSEDCGICPGEPLKTFSVVARIGCAGTKSVIIVEYAGSPLQDASYSIREEGRIGGNIIASGRTDKNGKIAFVPPTQGQYSLSLSKTDFYPFSRIYSVSCTKEKEEPQCLSSLDCPSGYLCEGRKCVQIVLNQTLPDLACLADSDCKKGEICVGGFCIRASCDDDSQCLDNQYCSWGRCLQISGKCGYAANHTWINYECCSSLDCKEGEECIDNRCVISPLILKQEAQKEIEEAKKALNEATGKETRQAYEELNNALYAFSKGNYEEALKLAKASKLSAKNAPPKTLIPKPPSPSQLPYYSVLFGAAYVLVLFAAISVGSLLALMVILLRKHKVSTLQVRYYPELEIAAKRKLEVKVEEAPPEPLFPTIDLAQVFWSHQAKVVYGIMFVALLVSVSLLYLFQTKEGIISIEQQEYIIEIDAIYSVLSIIAGGLIVSVIYLTSQYISLRPYKPIHTTEAVAREPQTLPSQRVIVLPHISMPSIRISLPPIHLPHIRLSIPIPRIVIPQFHLYAPLIRVPILRIPKIKVRAPVFRVPKMRIEIPHLYLPHIRIILPRIVVPEVHPPKPLIQLSVPRIKVSHILPTYRLNLLELAYELLAFVLFAFSSGLMLISSVVGMQPIVIDAEYMVIELNTLLLLYAISIFGIFGSVAMFVSRKLLIEEKPYWVLAIALVVFIAIILAVAAFISGTETYSIIGTTLLSSLDSASTYANNLFASIYLVNANYTGTNHEKAERIPFYPLNRDGQVFPQNRYAVSPFTYIYYIVPPNKSDKFLHSAIISDAYFASQFVSYPLVGEPLSFSLGSCPSLTYSTHSISIRGESNSEFKLCVKEKDGTFHEILLQFGYEKDRLYLISK
ncbi:MAG: PEGA domain-containing protein [Candidatus Anstonellales archaeon]